MKIDKMIERLQTLKEKHGNIEVGAKDDEYFYEIRSCRMVKDFFGNDRWVVGLYDTRIRR